LLEQRLHMIKQVTEFYKTSIILPLRCVAGT